MANQRISKNLKKQFAQLVQVGFESLKSVDSVIVDNQHMEHLPGVVRKYLYYVGVPGRQMVHHVKINFDGIIRTKPTDGWMKIRALQHSYFNIPSRLFYLKAWKMGIPAIGLHKYIKGEASMEVKLLNLFKLADEHGALMNQSETVTHFNDMCLMAPATLIDKNIRWTEIDPLTVKASYSINNINISAVLFFNNEGQLINFISNDRYDLGNGKMPTLNPFSTPIESYGEYNGFRLANKAKTIYHRPDGDFCYGEFKLMSIEYNLNIQNPNN